MMDDNTFRKLFQDHRDKISQAWLKLTHQDLDSIAGDLAKFLEKVSAVYKIPHEVILRQLDAVQKNIDEGIDTDFAPYLDPRE